MLRPGLLALVALLALATPAYTSLGVRDYTRLASDTNGLGPLPDNASFGRSATRVSDLDGDGHDDLLVGQAWNYQAPGAISVLMLDVDQTVLSEVRLEAGSNGVPLAADYGLGWALEAVGDLDGDGTDDVAVGAPSYDGSLWIFFLNPDGTVKATHAIDETELPGLAIDAHFGKSLEFLGDRDGNGKPELAAGTDDALWILELDPDGTVADHWTIPVSEAGLEAFLGFGAFANSVVQIDDLDGNGRADLAVGSTVYENYYPNSYAYYGVVSILSLDAGDSVIGTSLIGLDNGGFTEPPNQSFGAELAWIEDANCGESLLAVGEPLQSVAGRVWLLGLDASGQVLEQGSIEYDEASLGDPDHDYHASNSAFGRLAGVGDLDGDGVDDLVVGAPEYAFDEGELWILRLTPSYVDRRILDFGYVFTGESGDSTVTLFNDGCVPVAGSLGSDSTDFSIAGGGGAFSVDPGDSLTVALSFVPQGGNLRGGNLATDSAFGTIQLRGTGRIATDPCLGHWNLDTFNAANLGPGPDNHALWCGVQAGEPYYATPPGFGNNWDEPLVYAAPVDPFVASNPVRVRFDYNIDLPGGEFRLERLVNGVFVELYSRSGSSRDSTGEFSAPEEFDLSFDVPGVDRVYLDGAPAVVFRLRVLTSGYYSDQTGIFDTDGAIQIDNLQVWVDGVLVSDADFEPGGSDGGWCTDPRFDIPDYTNAWHAGFEEPPMGNGLGGSVLKLMVYQDQLVAGGSFTQAGPVTANRVAAFDGEQWHALGEGFADGDVWSLVEYDGKLYAGGGFTVAGGSPADHLAVWDGATWQPAGYTPSETVWSMGVWQGELWVPDRQNGSASVNRFDGVQWSAMAAPLGISTWTEFQGAMHVTTFTGRLYRLDGSTFTQLGQMNNDVYASVVHDGLLLIGGIWNVAPTGGSIGITGWNGSGWVEYPGPQNPYTETLAVYNGRLIAASTSAPTITSWIDGQPRPMDRNLPSGGIRTLVVYDGSLWAGGEFRSIAGKESWYIARWTDPAPVAAPDVPSNAPVRVTLGPGRPNPFNPRVTFSFSIPSAGPVRAVVYDLRGRRVATLLEDSRAAGTYPLVWDGRDGSGRTVASGAYFVRVEHEAGSAVRRVVLLK